MKKLSIVTLAATMFATLAMAASFTGWVSDEKCGAKGANAEHASCAKGCIKGGTAPVLATEAGKVYKFSNPDKVTEFAGEKVEVSGTADGAVITVESVKKAD